MPKRLFATLAAALALAGTPASALGQSAGDDQYQDPLAVPEEPRQSDEQRSTPAQSTPAEPAAAPAAAAEPSDAPSAAPAEELPRTGLPAGLVALAGAVMTGAGVALRRRL